MIVRWTTERTICTSMFIIMTTAQVTSMCVYILTLVTISLHDSISLQDDGLRTIMFCKMHTWWVLAAGICAVRVCVRVCMCAVCVRVCVRVWCYTMTGLVDWCLMDSPKNWNSLLHQRLPTLQHNANIICTQYVMYLHVTRPDTYDLAVYYFSAQMKQSCIPHMG